MLVRGKAAETATPCQPKSTHATHYTIDAHSPSAMKDLIESTEAADGVSAFPRPTELIAV